MNDKYIKFNTNLWVYDNMNGKKIEIADKNTKAEYIQTKNGWIQHSRGWSKEVANGFSIEQSLPTVFIDAAKDPNVAKPKDDPLLKPLKDIGSIISSPLFGTSLKPPDPSKKTKAPDKNKDSKDKKDGDQAGTEGGANPNGDNNGGLDAAINKSWSDWWKGFTPLDTVVVGDKILNNMNGIFGMPYQYTSMVDRRLEKTNYGRFYGERILARMPLMLISPGKVNFMAGFSSDLKNDFLQAYGKDDGKASEIINGSGGGGSLYQFQYDTADYFKTVNSMCSVMALYLGIQDVKCNGTTLGKMQWNKNMNPQLGKITASINANALCFYLDAETQVSESYGNTTKDSMLAGLANSGSEMMQQIGFLLGGMTGGKFQYFEQKNGSKVKSAIDSATGLLKGILPTQLINKVNGSVSSILAGGKIAFPELWTDSSVNNSYDISIKLVTPDGDSVSWFLNIGVPMMHLLALTLPRAMDSELMAYNSPYLVRAYYKSFFNINMGIISNLNIRRGDKNKWTLAGLPTEVDIQMQIKDLFDYLTLALPKEEFVPDVLSMYKNSNMTDYIANLCGVNYNAPDIIRTLELYKLAVGTGLNNILTLNSPWMHLSDTINNALTHWSKGL